MRDALARLLLAVWFVLVASPGAAQGRVSGYDAFVEGSTRLVRERENVVRGVAYEVRGLATLVPRAGLSLRARFVDDGGRVYAEVVARSGPAGRFAMAIVPPAEAPESGALEVTVGSDSADTSGGEDADEIADEDVDEMADEGERVDGAEDSAQAPEVLPPIATTSTHTFPASTEAPYQIVLRTDRNLYEPGEPIHVIARVRDAQSLATVGARDVEFRIELPGAVATRRTVRTGPDGVASFALEAAERGFGTITAHLAGASGHAGFAVGERRVAPMFVRVVVPREPLRPGVQASVQVFVTTVSGAPLEGAAVELRAFDATSGVTDALGQAVFSITAPPLVELTSDSRVVEVTVTHGAVGTVRAVETLHVEVPETLHVELLPRSALGLVPEVPDDLYVVLTDSVGHPIASRVVDVVGPAIAGGRARVTTDAHGIGVVRVLLPRGVSSVAEEGRAETTLEVSAPGRVSLSTRIAVSVATSPDVIPRVRSVVVAPGAPFEVAIHRRPSVRNRAVTLSILDGTAILATTTLEPGVDRAVLRAPLVAGVMVVRARAVLGDEVTEGVGAFDTVLIAPTSRHPAAISVARPVVSVGESIAIDVATGVAPAGVRTFASVLVRDLARHEGETPYQEGYLGHVLDEALTQSGESADRVLRVAMAAHEVPTDDAPRAHPLRDRLGRLVEAADTVERDLRDPVPLAAELARRGVAGAMRFLETALRDAVENDALDSITRVRGGRRLFREDLLLDASSEDGVPFTTLTGDPMRPSDLSASDPSFTFDAVARRVARGRLVRLLAALAQYLDPGDEASPRARLAAREPSNRWLSGMLARAMISAADLRDPWGRTYRLVRHPNPPFVLSHLALGLALVSPGPDGAAGTNDDVIDPFARVVPAGTPYALHSGEDDLMTRLSTLSALGEALPALEEAYRRVAVEVREEAIGDAMGGGTGEGALGFGGMGAGGSGSGYGSGYGSARTIGTPSVRTAGAYVTGLAEALRERFPATLHFVPSIELQNGTARVEARAADAVTTYVVEVITWRTDGWVSSAATEVRVERTVVVDAPIPAHGMLGDRLVVPLRVANHGATPIRVRLGHLEVPELGIPASASSELEVPPGQARRTDVAVVLAREGRGTIRIVATTPEGRALDAIARPLEASPPMRTQHEAMRAIGAGDLELAWSTDPAGRPWQASLTLADAPMFTPSAIGLAWARALHGRPDGSPQLRGDDLRALVVRVAAADMDPSVLQERIAGLSPAQALLALAPLARSQEPLVRQWLDSLRSQVLLGIASSQDPASVTEHLVALAWTGEPGDRIVVEHIRRLDRLLVEVGGGRVIASDVDPIRATVAYALTLAHEGRADEARALAEGLVAFASASHGEDIATALVAIELTGAPVDDSTARLEIDGIVHEAARPRGEDGRLGDAAWAEAGLSGPGSHRVVAPSTARTRILRLSRTTLLPWTSARAPRVEVAIARGATPARIDSRMEVVMEFTNRTARPVHQATVDVLLPTGFEVEAAASHRILVEQHTRMQFRLAGLGAGQRREIRFWVIPRVAGSLHGFGVVVTPDGEQASETILPPSEVLVSEGGAR